MRIRTLMTFVLVAVVASAAIAQPTAAKEENKSDHKPILAEEKTVETAA